MLNWTSRSGRWREGSANSAKRWEGEKVDHEGNDHDVVIFQSKHNPTTSCFSCFTSSCISLPTSLIKPRIMATPVLFSSLPSLFTSLPLLFPLYHCQSAHEPAATHCCPEANQGHGKQTRQGRRCYKVHYCTHIPLTNHYMHHVSMFFFSCLSHRCISTVLWRQTLSCV